MRKVPLFQDLLPSDFEVLSFILEEIAVPEGQYLFKQGETASCLYVVESGQIEILKRIEDEDLLVATLGPGEVLGEMALVRDTSRSSSARTTEMTTLQVLKKEKLATLMRKDMRIWAQLAFNIARILATRLERMDRLLTEKGSAPQETGSIFSRLFG